MKKAAANLHKTSKGQIAMGFIALLLTYVFALEAIDTARLLYYFGTVLLALMGLRWLVVGFVALRRTAHS